MLDLFYLFCIQNKKLYSLSYRTMTSTIWFWIVVAILIFFLLIALRKFIGRIVVIFIFLATLFLVYRLINPTGARSLWITTRNIPIKTTNFINATFLKSEAHLPLIEPAIQEPTAEIKEEVQEKSEDTRSWFQRIFSKKKIEEPSTENSQDQQSDSPVKQEPSKRFSRFSNLFKKKSSSQEQNKEEFLIASWAVEIEAWIIGEQEQAFFQNQELKTGDVTILSESELVTGELSELDESETEAIFYIPSNPVPAEEFSKTERPSSSQTTSSSSNGLSEADLQEAYQIFNP